jgi:hypothetical protein
LAGTNRLSVTCNSTLALRDGFAARPEVELGEDADPFGGPDVGRSDPEIMPHASCRDIGGGYLPWLDDPLGCA